MGQSKIKVVLAEDNPMVHQGIRKLLTNSQNIELVGEAWNGLEAMRLVADLKPDVLLLDVEMPVLDGIAVTRGLKTGGSSGTRILVLSAYNDKHYIREMLLNGASGYLLKDEAPERIITAIQGIALGKLGWVSPDKKQPSSKKKGRDTRF